MNTLREVVADALKGWIEDGDSIPAPIIEACRNAIMLEFGNNGTDGYYKRILVRVFKSINATPTPEASAGVEERAREILSDVCAPDGRAMQSLCDGTVPVSSALAAIAAALRTPAKTEGDVGLNADELAVLRRLKDALPTVGLNGWYRGVAVLEKILDTPPAQQEARAVDDAMVERAIAAHDAYWADDANYPVRATRSVNDEVRLNDRLERGSMRAALTAALAAGKGEAGSA